MRDVAVAAPAGAASLARIGAALGGAGISVAGGGMWESVAHYLVADADRAARALAAAGLGDVVVRETVVVPLAADVPGELGRMTAALAAAGVRLLAQYSDHDNQKVFVVDDPAAARAALG